eukprot:764796-Hanusia_phi.AAC.10
MEYDRVDIFCRDWQGPPARAGRSTAQRRTVVTVTVSDWTGVTDRRVRAGPAPGPGRAAQEFLSLFTGVI